MSRHRLNQMLYDLLTSREMLEVITGTAHLVTLRTLALMDPKERDRTPDRQYDGGVLSVALKLGEPPDCKTSLIGHFDRIVDVVKFTETVHDTMLRLLSGTDISSWSTRDKGAGKYGGGIQLLNEPRALRRIVIAFSGFTEHWNEAICVATLALLDLITWEQIEEIDRISDNPHIQTLLNALGINATNIAT